MLKGMVKCGLFIGLGSSLAACSYGHLSVTPTESKPLQGIVYALPLSTFDISTTRQLIKCDSEGFLVKTEISVTPHSIEDPANLYVIDPHSLSEIFNTSTVKVDFHEGTRFLKSVNADGTGAAQELLTSVIKTTASIYGVEFGGSGSEALAPTEQPSVCTEEAVELLDGIKRVSSDIKRVTKEIQEQQVVLDSAVLAQARILPGRTKDADELVASAKTLLEALAAQLETLIKTDQRFKNPLISTVTERWPTDGSETNKSNITPLPKITEKKWFGAIPGEGNPLIDSMINLTVALEGQPGIGRTLSDIEPAKWRTSFKGLYYRNPVAAELKFTRSNVKLAKKPDPEKIESVEQPPILVARESFDIAQLGYVNSLKVKNGAFESTEFSAMFDVAGRLVSSESKKIKSAATSAAEILDVVKEEFQTLKELEKNEPQNALNSQLALLQAELNILQTQKSIADFGDTDSELQTQAFEEQQKIIEAEIALFEAMKKLENLKSGES